MCFVWVKIDTGFYTLHNDAMENEQLQSMASELYKKHQLIHAMEFLLAKALAHSNLPIIAYEYFENKYIFGAKGSVHE